jgi:hypothetical protein
VKENGELKNMNELTLRGRCDCGKGRAHLVMMNLPEEDDWKHYKETVRKANVSCLKVVADTSGRPSEKVNLTEEAHVCARVVRPDRSIGRAAHGVRPVLLVRHAVAQKARPSCNRACGG